jgi:GNAT superfamily N-acetyltransferase
MIPYPLTQLSRYRLSEAFKDCRRVDLGIDCLLEGRMGDIFVYDLESPAAFLGRIGFFCYFAGDPGSAQGRELIAAIEPPALLMPAAAGWLDTARAVFGSVLIPNERYSFSSERMSAAALLEMAGGSPWAKEILPIDRYTALADREGLINYSTFDSVDDFLERSFGFFLPGRRGPAGAAYASLVCGHGIEVSLVVEPDYRRQGLGLALAARLLAESLGRGLDPHWDAGNDVSRHLAEKLGYLPAGSYQALYLPG